MSGSSSFGDVGREYYDVVGCSAVLFFYGVVCIRGALGYFVVSRRGLARFR